MTNIATTLKLVEIKNYGQLNIEVQECIEKFYLQLNYQPVIFTTAGFYKINLALLASIATGIVSYQIILVQFYAAK